jgi:hypothetical protein
LRSSSVSLCCTRNSARSTSARCPVIAADALWQHLHAKPLLRQRQRVARTAQRLFRVRQLRAGVVFVAQRRVRDRASFLK